MVKKGSHIRRSHYVDLLDTNTNSIRKGIAKNIALLGPRKSGKTSIVKEHISNVKNAIPIYIDFGKISLNPENFSVELIGNVIFHFLRKPLSEYQKALQLEHILKTENEIPKNVFALIESIDNELLKIKPSQKLLVETSFKFAEALAKESNKRFLFVMDNIENLFDLNNFSQIHDILSLINFESEYVSYIATSSAIKLSLNSLKKFECHELKNLDRDETIKLVESITGKGSPSIAEEIFSFGNGHVLITTLIARKFNDVKNVRKAFLIELLVKDNGIHNYCSNSLDYYYNRARGQTLLKTILKVVAAEELRLSEIARKIYRSAPVTKSILERLMDVDIIYRKDNRFYFSDNVLRLWIKLTSKGYDFDEVPDDKILDEAAKEL